MRGKSHSAEERLAAVNLVAEHGLAHAWRETGIPKPTLARWADEFGVERTNTEKTRAATDALRERHASLREQVRLELMEKVADLLDRMDAPHVEFKGKDSDKVEYPIAPAGAVQNYATSIGILIDKYRLEVGEATGRTESLAGVIPDEHKRQLLDALVRVRQELDAERSAHAGERPTDGHSVGEAGETESTPPSG